MIAAGGSPRLEHLRENFFGQLARDFALADQCDQFAQMLRRAPAIPSISLPAAFNKPVRSPITQFAVARPSPLTLAAALEVIAGGARRV